MTWYSPYNTYSNQFQYYHPYSYSSYHSTPYGTMTGRKNCLKILNINLCINLDASFQNGYYAVDGQQKDSRGKSGSSILPGLFKVGLKLANIALGGDSGDFGPTITAGLFTSITMN